MTIQERKKATKAIILARVSSKEQEEGYSIDAQRRRLEEYCIRRELELIKVYELIESSTVGNRKKFMEALKYAKEQRGTTAIVTDKVDRLQRGFKESPLLNDLIEKEKIELHFHVENCVIHKYSTSNEKLMWNMNVVMAQSFVDSLRDNVNRSIEQKLLCGEWISTAPIGYLHIKGGRGKGKIIVDTERAPLVKKLFEKYATGTYTIPQMLKKTKEWGLTNYRGNQGYLCRSHVHAILCNPFYYGVMYYKKGNKHYPHVYEPIITRELFDKCTSVRKGWNKKPFKWGGIDYMLRGLITCATTGKVVSCETKRRKRTDGSVYEVTYLGPWNPDAPEKKIFVKEEEVIKQIEDIFRSMHIEPETLKKVIEYVKSSADGERYYYKTRITELNKELTRIKAKLDKLMDFFLEDKINQKEHDEKRNQLIRRRGIIMMELEEHNNADDNFTENMINVLNLAANAHKTFLLSINEKKRKLIKLVLSTVKLNGRKLEFTLRPPFDTFVETAKNGEWRTREESNL